MLPLLCQEQNGSELRFVWGMQFFLIDEKITQDVLLLNHHIIF